ncbi:serine/threonine-protein phosphatase with EF-hands 2 isoform X2 [Pyxicephalus adspersus]|uniref:serine/threonine-protein phosphatase with EF-hands 2 isoform X2 n=1 Tax=Pyxicephalus adspersus TaxID=30357 RepID=UPI003B5BB443
MGCGTSSTPPPRNHSIHKSKKGSIAPRGTAFKSAVLIQRWYRRYVAQLEVRRRCTWSIFQSIEYTGEQDQIKLYDFFNFLMDHFTPDSKERNFICRMFTEEENLKETELEKYCDYEFIEVPETYIGPKLTFPLKPSHAAALVEAFKQKQQLHARYVLQLLIETRKHLKQLPNIKRITTSYSKEITICGDLHGRLDDLFLIFYKNGLPSAEKPYIFNGDFVDRGRQSVEILMILFAFLLVYPKAVHLNRGNHEDYMVNLRYGFTKEVMKKYKVHGKKILKMLQTVFSWLPLAAVIDQKILITHGGVSDSTDLEILSKIERHKFASTLRPRKKKDKTAKTEEKTDQGKCTNGENTLPVASSWQPPRSGSFSYSSSPSLLPNYKGKRSASSPTTMTIDRKEISKRVREAVDKELVKYRRQVGITDTITGPDSLVSVSDSESESGEMQEYDMDTEERKQIVDILWSDPIPQDGCKSNTVRGGGCYFGPDVTEKILQKHGLQMLIRSHECKQEGYEFCHNGKVLTIFSASNYYEVGSNKGAYVKLGPDLVPHFVQYQANKTTNTLTMRQRVSTVEESALRALREKLFAHKSVLLKEFKKYDVKRTGYITLNDWATALEAVLKLGLPWRMLRPQLVRTTTDGLLKYKQWFDELSMCQPIRENIQSSLLEALYRNRSDLETIFRIIDSDSSGLISFEEFHHTWKLLSSHLNIEVGDEAIANMARSIDFNKDGNIDINEFLEAFRLADRPHAEDKEL